MVNDHQHDKQLKGLIAIDGNRCSMRAHPNDCDAGITINNINKFTHDR